jgi:DNA repair ATPase RecN
MEEINNINEVEHKTSEASGDLENLAEKIKVDEITINNLVERVSELSHLNEAETGFNPTPAEFAAEFEDIKAEVLALGKPLRVERDLAPDSDIA